MDSLHSHWRLNSGWCTYPNWNYRTQLKSMLFCKRCLLGMILNKIFPNYIQKIITRHE